MGKKGCRYTLEEKLQCIRLVESGMTTYAVECSRHISHSQIEQWIARYQRWGNEGLEKYSHPSHYSIELKREIALKYLDGNTSYPQLAHDYQIPNWGTIHRWVTQYTSGKLLNTTRRPAMRDGRQTTQLERIEIAQWVMANDMDYVGATLKFKVSYGQVYGWVKRLKNGGQDALADRRGKAKEDRGQLTENEKLVLENKRLKAQIEQLSSENDLAKKIQELERRAAPKQSSVKPSKRSHKK